MERYAITISIYSAEHDHHEDIVYKMLRYNDQVAIKDAIERYNDNWEYDDSFAIQNIKVEVS